MYAIHHSFGITIIVMITWQSIGLAQELSVVDHSINSEFLYPQGLSVDSCFEQNRTILPIESMPEPNSENTEYSLFPT